MKPVSIEAYHLMHEGILALAKMQRTGIRIDTSYCLASRNRIAVEIKDLTKKVIDTKEVRMWRKVYGTRFNINSGDQLGVILFKQMGLKAPKQTTAGGDATDADALDQIARKHKLEFLRDIVRIRKLTKARDTYLDAIFRESVNGYLHPHFNLHTTITYRSSSGAPNFQNIPVRDAMVKELVRRAFIPRKGRQLVEVDYSAIEVRVAACYHKDPTMLRYIKDKSTDMHRDMAMDLYLLDRDDVSDATRHTAKNKFVFPEFYGDYWESVAEALWSAVLNAGLALPNGQPLREHLRGKGIRNKDQFAEHVRKVEEHFWNVRFPVYTQWKKAHMRQYQNTGYFDTLTGFRCQGVYRRNQVINLPVQGSAFHCLLWSITEAVLREIPKHRFKSCAIGQIHDSGLFDVVPEELPDFLALMREIMTEKIRKQFPWLIVPLDVGIDVAPVDQPWYFKAKYKPQEK